MGRQPTDKHVIHIKRNGKRALRLGVKGEVVADLGKEAMDGLAHQRAFQLRAWAVQDKGRCPGRGPASPKAWDGTELCTFLGWQGVRMREDVSEMKLDGYQGPDQDFRFYSEENGKITGGLWARQSYILSDFSSVQLLSCVQLFATPWTAAHQASLSITNSCSLLKLMSIESVMPSNHLIICCPLLLLP